MNSLDFLKGGDDYPYGIKKVDSSVLINGEALEVMQLLIDNNVKVDAIITDIPYG